MTRVFSVKMHYADDKGREHRHVFQVRTVPGEDVFATARRDGPRFAKKARIARMLRKPVAVAA